MDILIYSAQLERLPGRGEPWPSADEANHVRLPRTRDYLRRRLAGLPVFGQMAVGLYAIAMLMLVAVLFVGDSVYGSRRWFTFAGQQIQASEVAKLFVIIALARYLADRQPQYKRFRYS